MGRSPVQYLPSGVNTEWSESEYSLKEIISMDVSYHQNIFKMSVAGDYKRNSAQCTMYIIVVHKYTVAEQGHNR